MKRSTLYMIGGGGALALLLWPRGARALPGSPRASGNVYWPYWPVPGTAYLSSLFGCRNNIPGIATAASPLCSSGQNFHNGIDLSAPLGTPVFAAAGGTVTTVSSNASSGNFVGITHSSGWASFYCHLDRAVVSKGDHVAAGTLIGIMDSTGASTGSHVHFMTTLNGEARDPQSVIGSWPGSRSGGNVAGVFGGIAFGGYGADVPTPPLDLNMNQPLLIDPNNPQG